MTTIPLLENNRQGDKYSQTILLGMASTQIISTSTGIHPKFPKTAQPEAILVGRRLPHSGLPWTLMLSGTWPPTPSQCPLNTQTHHTNKRERDQRVPCSEGLERGRGQQESRVREANAQLKFSHTMKWKKC